MQESKGQFKLNMDGLLEVLAGSLYANPIVGLRELIQNAHDSCTRYGIESGRTHFQPRIHVEVDSQAHTLTVTDNGSGLTHAEIETYLTTIGRSYTRELRNDLSIFEPESSDELIGQFGFGFLSAFMLANEVDMVTKSWKEEEGHGPLRWSSAGGDSFSIEAADASEAADLLGKHGTRIALKLNADGRFLLDVDILSEKVRQFANFLPIPIYINDDQQPTNAMVAPWDQPDIGAAMTEFIMREFEMRQRPLAVIQLHDHIKILPNGDTLHVPLSGFVFVPDSSVASVREFGDLHVYIRGMFITDNETELLPAWAKFARGLVESPYLHPTASRETVRRDENFSAVREALADQLSAGLQAIQNNDPATWRRIVRGHSDIMIGWAVRDDQFFEQVADILLFRTSQGEMTLPEYLKLTDRKLYYVTREIKSLQEKVLAEGNSAPVIEAVWFAVQPFLMKYAALHDADPERDSLTLVPLDEESTTLFKETDNRPFLPVLEACEQLNIKAEVAVFAPYQLPALLVHPKDAELWSDTRSALDSDEFDPSIADMVSAFLEDHIDESDQDGTLFINASCPFVRDLCRPEIAERPRMLVIQMLYQVARLFSGKTMNAATTVEAFENLTLAAGELIAYDA